jgi:hypothetical protein
VPTTTFEHADIVERIEQAESFLKTVCDLIKA